MLALIVLLAQEVEGQPLAANAARIVEALASLGAPAPFRIALVEAGTDPRKVQALLDPVCSFTVTLGAGARSAGPISLQQGAYTPLLVKVINPAGAKTELKVGSPQAGPVYAGVAELSMKRQNQPKLRQNENVGKDPNRFLDLEWHEAPPLTPGLSGLGVEYRVLLAYSTESGKREASIVFDGQAARAELDVKPALPLRLRILDHDGKPTTARLEFTDRAGRVHPPQPKRLAPDFFFQRQIYRHDGETVILPPGELRMKASRGPEYPVLERTVNAAAGEVEVRLKRWVDPSARGWWSGDHHIHAAGCAHYTSPSEGVLAPDMFRQVKGEGLNVGSVLTWGPCFDFQSRFFSPGTDGTSEPFTLLKYDVEVSGFGSQALGHVCLLNLKEQIYPGADGSKRWPTWTTPVLRWAKAQGGVTGYAHSASGLEVRPAPASKRLLAALDADRDGRLSAAEAAGGLLPAAFKDVDADGDGAVNAAELEGAHERAADTLPNLAVPEMNGVGAMEVFVTAASGLCDFMSAMDTARIPEWNAWYHLLNCGMPLKVSGETDFPCMSSTRVGQGRVYVKLGRLERLDYAAWCKGIAEGRSYVSDGYAHALEFSVEGKEPGEAVALERAGTVTVRAVVAFSPEIPAEVPYGGAAPQAGARVVGDTVDLHPAKAGSTSTRRVDLVMNGKTVESRELPADGREVALEFRVPVERSSWIAVRQFPQLHTNPVNVIVGGAPIRASRESALWSIACIEQLWRMRERNVAPAEREEARAAFQKAIETYRKIAGESPR